MSLIQSFRNEIISLSFWFKVIMGVTFAIYISFWLFTIHLRNVQEKEGIEPLIPVLAQDSEGYYKLSESIINRHEFGQEGKVETLRTPGYPLFAAIVKTLGGSYFAVTLVQVLIVFSSALLIRRIGIFIESGKIGEIAATLFLLNPVTLSLSLVILTDTLFLFLFILGFYLTLALKNKTLLLRIIIVSVVFAAALYTRLGIFAIPIFIVPVLILDLNWRLKIKFMVGITVMLLLCTLPWIYRNYQSVGIKGFTSFRSQNLGWAATKFLSSQNGTSQSEEYDKLLAKIGIDSSDYYDIRYADRIGKVAEAIVFEKPFLYARYHIISALPFMFPSTISFARDTYNSALHRQGSVEEGAISLLSSGKGSQFLKGIMKSWWKVLERLCWLAAYTISFFGIWQNRKKITIWVFIFVVGYLMLLAGPASGPRYTFQAFPFIFLLFSLFGMFWFNKIKKNYLGL